jgi:tetratricopeptide (TPR) repeat protein
MSIENDWGFRFSLPARTGDSIAKLLPEEAERLLLDRLRESKDDPRDALWQLALLSCRRHKYDLALDYLRQRMALDVEPDSKAATVLAMGQTMEQAGDYESAVRYYREAFALEPAHTRTWYFINNNLGYSLNRLGKFDEGEHFCRAAIAIDSQCPNAFKNLGIALCGQGELAEGAQCFINATRADASDPRAMQLLEALLTEHPELGFAAELEDCRQAVRMASWWWRQGRAR